MNKKLDSKKPATLSMKDIKSVGKKTNKRTSGAVRVQKFADYQTESGHVRLDEMIDETIYIVKIEPQQSKDYGEGYKLTFALDARSSEYKTASCYGAYVVPALADLYKLSHDGKLISPNNPVETTIRQAGKTYKFE